MSDALGEWDGDPLPDDPALRLLEDQVADAEGALRVAEVKAEEVLEDETKSRSQCLGAQEAAEKARRARDRATAALERARGEMVLLLDTSAPEEVPPEAAQPYYGSADEFFREYLRHLYAREIGGRGGGRVWRADWWRVPEAIARIDALWRSWEHLRLDGGTGSSVWWRDHADHHMAVLMDTDGPFKGSEDRCGRGEPLPYTPPPAGLFPDERRDGRA